MGAAPKPGRTAATTDPAVHATAGLLHRRRGWIWTLVVSLVGFIVAAWVAARPATGGTASLILDLIALLMVIAFVAALIMVLVVTARLRKHAPEVRGPALAVHRSTRHPVLAHPYNRRHHPYEHAFVLVMLLGWLVGAVVFLPRVVDSVAYLAGAGGHATFSPRSYVEQCSRGTGCTMITNGVLEIHGHPSAASWPVQVPMGVPFTVRGPVRRWGLGSGLVDGEGDAIGSIFVGLIVEGGALLALYVIARPGLRRLRQQRHPQQQSTVKWTPTPRNQRRR